MFYTVFVEYETRNGRIAANGFTARTLIEAIALAERHMTKGARVADMSEAREYAANIGTPEVYVVTAIDESGMWTLTSSETGITYKWGHVITTEYEEWLEIANPEVFTFQHGPGVYTHISAIRALKDSDKIAYNEGRSHFMYANRYCEIECA